MCTWKWRIRSSKPQSTKDFNVLKSGAPQANQTRARFDEAVNEKLTELGHDRADSTNKLYADICTAIHHAIDKVLPTTKKEKHQKREVSARTKKLFNYRSDPEESTEPRNTLMKCKRRSKSQAWTISRDG